ncbi:ATP-dependent sacrificial sulfur transferase LarE [Anaerolentibacter hominis]|uniref:ATP-dependent sacrificial sulfur transferase LarE n=1 Tax=Anaerolentibacter hominis TaxID=3079009 RepID=UPI0031B8749E
MSRTIPDNLREFFHNHRRAALAFSGGVDSAYLMYAACECGCDLHAYYVKSQFQPEFEYQDALKLAGEMQCGMTVIELDVLADEKVVSNPADRCYYCKQRIFTSILDHAAADGCELLMDGTNASDDAGDRPGMRALRELKVVSPLRECGLTKAQIRDYSREAGLFTWKKPAYACLATRIPTGVPLTAQVLTATEAAEAFLMALGFEDFRVRMAGKAARLQVKAEQMEQVIQMREMIYRELMKWYPEVYLDLGPRG